MNANDKTEKVLREIHIMLSKAEPYKPEPSRVIINKQQMIDLLAELNKCIYAMHLLYIVNFHFFINLSFFTKVLFICNP